MTNLAPLFRDVQVNDLGCCQACPEDKRYHDSGRNVQHSALGSRYARSPVPPTHLSISFSTYGRTINKLNGRFLWGGFMWKFRFPRSSQLRRDLNDKGSSSIGYIGQICPRVELHPLNIIKATLVMIWVTSGWYDAPRTATYSNLSLTPGFGWLEKCHTIVTFCRLKISSTLLISPLTDVHSFRACGLRRLKAYEWSTPLRMLPSALHRPSRRSPSPWYR